MKTSGGHLKWHMKYANMVTRGHKEGKNEGKPKTVRMPKYAGQRDLIQSNKKSHCRFLTNLRFKKNMKIVWKFRGRAEPFPRNLEMHTIWFPESPWEGFKKKMRKSDLPNLPGTKCKTYFGCPRMVLCGPWKSFANSNRNDVKVFHSEIVRTYWLFVNFNTTQYHATPFNTRKNKKYHFKVSPLKLLDHIGYR